MKKKDDYKKPITGFFFNDNIYRQPLLELTTWKSGCYDVTVNKSLHKIYIRKWCTYETAQVLGMGFAFLLSHAVLYRV